MSRALHTQIVLVKNTYELLWGRIPEHSQGRISHYTTPESNPIGGFTHLDKPIIILPGFINLHAHLAYTYPFSTEVLPQTNLFDWLSRLVDEQFPVSSEDLLKQHLSNIKAALASGTTYIVDNSRCPEISLKAFQKLGLRGLIGIEVFGSDPALADEIFVRKLEELEHLVFSSTDNLNPACQEALSKIQFCFSPHATYDVSIPLMKQLLDWTKSNAKNKILPLLLSHAAESPIEEAWFNDKDSLEAKPAREFWNKINTLEAKLKNWQAYPSSIAMLAANNLLNEHLVLTHLCCASDADLELLRTAKTKLITCPRSNENIGNPKARIDKWFELGFKPGLGTDSLASAPDMDLRKELAKLNLSPEQKLDMVTINAARILGKEKEIGSLELGCRADYVVYEVTRNDIDLKKVDPIKLVLDTEVCKVKSVCIDGKNAVSA